MLGFACCGHPFLIWHAIIADFDFVLVEDFVELVLRKTLQMLLEVLLLKGGLNQMMFLFWLFCTRSFGVGLHSKLWLYPDLSRTAL